MELKLLRKTVREVRSIALLDLRDLQTIKAGFLLFLLSEFESRV